MTPKQMCCVQSETSGTSQRISGEYKPGKGDSGYTSPVTGRKFSKAGEATKFYGAVERLQLALEKAIILNKENPFKQGEVIEVIKWLRQTTCNLMSYCYYMADDGSGKPNENELPEHFTQYIVDQANIWRPLYGGSKEFQVFTEKHCVALNAIRVETRCVEVAFCEWEQSFEIVSHLASFPQLGKSIERHRQTLNRLSDYWWCAINREAYRRGKPQRYWQGKIPALKVDLSQD